MKNTLFILLLLIIVTTSCERDDICIDATTPNLLINFFDNEDPTETNPVTNLSVRVLEIENDSLPLLTNDTIVSVPLKVTELNTRYILTLNSLGDSSTDATIKLNRDTINVTYTPQEVFVGRACGFKSVFNNVTYELTDDSNNWIKSLEVVSDTINDETVAHVKIFH